MKHFEEGRYQLPLRSADGEHVIINYSFNASSQEWIYPPSVAAQVVHGKFGLHLPYYRLQDMFAKSGWTPSRSTLDYLTELVHETTQDLSKRMLGQIKKGDAWDSVIRRSN